MDKRGCAKSFLVIAAAFGLSVLFVQFVLRIGETIANAYGQTTANIVEGTILVCIIIGALILAASKVGYSDD